MDINLLQIFDLQSAETHRGIAYSGELWANGRLACRFSDQGDGSEMRISWVSQEVHAEVADYCDRSGEILTPAPGQLPNLPMTPALLIAALCDEEACDQATLATERGE